MRVRFSTIAWLVIGLAACSEDRITRPSVPGGNTASVLSGWASLEVNRDDPTARAELATYPDWTLVRVDVSGQTLWKWNVDCFVGCFPPHAVGDVQLTTNPRGSYFSGWCQTVVGIYFNYSYEIAPTGCVFGSEPTPTDFSWYSVVKGTVEAFRNGAVQYHCPNQGGPYPGPMCTYYEGYAEVSLTWVSAALNLTASAASIVHGNSVTFTATADPATVGGRVVPLNIQSWEWESNYGGSTNPGCGTATQCVYSPVTSGTMRVSGLVNQDLQEAIVSVIVTDSTECGGSQIRSMTQMNLSSGCEGGGGDTTGGGGGNGGLPTLLLSCVDSATLSSTITRGQTAVCRMSMSDSSSPPVSVLRAEGAPNAVYYLSGPYGGVASVTLPYAWVGRVAASGVVSAEVDVGGHPVRQTATLNVVPRTWTPTIQPPVTTYGGLGRADLRLWGYPARAIGASRVGPNENNVKAMIVGGPNDGVWWAANQPLIYDSIWIHPGLDSARAAAVGGGPLQWYNDQNGIPAGTCNSTYMPALLADVLRHEGVTLSSDSHRGHWVAALPGSGLTGDWEKSYHRASADLSSLMFGSIWGRVNSLQLQHERAYDSTQNSTSTISARVTGNACIFDYDSTAN